MARVVWSPEEFSGLNEVVAQSLGWTGSFAFQSNTGGITPAKDPSGRGGNFFIHGGTSGTSCTSPAVPVATNHFFIKGRVYVTGFAASGAYMQALDTGGAVDFTIAITATGEFSVSDANGTLATGTAQIVVNQWYLIEAEVYFDGANGYVKTWIDGTLDIDTGATAVTGGPVEKFRNGTGGNTFTPREAWDDFCVNTITLRYDTGSSFAPAVGDTITDGGTSSTAKVAGLQGDGTIGTLTIENPSGAFGDGNALTITGSGSGTASVDAPNADFINGLEPNSSRLGNEFVLAVVPTGAGAFTQLTPSTGSNFDNVNDIAPNTGTYNEASAADQQDTYTHDATTKLGTTSRVTAVASFTYARSSLTGIDGAEHLLRNSGGTLYSSGRFSLNSSYGGEIYTWDTRPDTDAGWGLTGLTTGFPQFGIKFVV